MDACGRARSLRVDAHDHHANPSTAVDRNLLETEAEITAGDASVALERRSDAIDRGRWDDQHADADRIPSCRQLGLPRRGRGRLLRSAAGADRAPILASISPPRMDRQGPAARETTPSAAVGEPSSAPTAMTSAPTVKDDAARPAGCRPECSMRSTATSVVGSRPTSFAATVIPARHCDGRATLLGQPFVGGNDELGPPDDAARPRAVERTETMVGAALVTRPESAVDTSFNWSKPDAIIGHL